MFTNGFVFPKSNKPVRIFPKSIMPVVTFDYRDFIDLLGHELPKKKLVEQLPMIGADLDKVEGDQISIEFFPDRPDLASVEGIAKAARAFFGFKPGLTNYPVKKSDVILTVDSSVKKVRPNIAAAVIRDVSMTEELVTSLMDLQEKLHFGLGRNRKKVAIGVHNFEPIQPPFTYKAVNPDSIEFVPLAKIESMTLKEILRKHEKGIAYAHLLKDHDKYPVIVDSNENVLSFPPIINGSLTEVTPFTTDLFIDVTGTNQKAVHHALIIVATALAERGGKIYTVAVEKQGTSNLLPDLTPQTKTLSLEYVNKILGTNMNPTDAIKTLKKMGYHAKKQKKNTIHVEIPAWRVDILHQIDLIEDVAIGYGFDTFQVDLPHHVTFGKTLPQQKFNDTLRTILVGLGFNEVTTLTISNEDNEFTKLGLKKGKCVKIKNPIGEEYSCLRVGLLPSLLGVLSDNKHHSLPQQIFELGKVVDENGGTHQHLAAMKIDAKTGFTECKSLVEAVLRDIGIELNVQKKQHAAFVKGRCASIQYHDKEIGFFGEIHPRTITNHELKHPIIAFEINIDLLTHVQSQQ